MINNYNHIKLNQQSHVISMSRIRPNDAMKHLGDISRDSFQKWCVEANIKSYDYEFSTRKYFIKGEFLAIADRTFIERLKDLHGEKWNEFYPYYDEVYPFLQEEKVLSVQEETYKPKSKDVSEFIKKLKE